MKKRMMILSIILIFCFISACSQIGNGLEDEEEAAELYEKKFQDKSENWEVTLHLKEYQTEHLYTEESIFRFERLTGFYDLVRFNFEMIYGDPIKYTVTPLNNTMFTEDQKEYQVKLDQQRIIEEVCFGQFTIKVIWTQGLEEPQEESFVFKDHENPMCEHVDRIASKD